MNIYKNFVFYYAQNISKTHRYSLIESKFSISLLEEGNYPIPIPLSPYENIFEKEDNIMKSSEVEKFNKMMIRLQIQDDFYY